MDNADTWRKLKYITAYKVSVTFVFCKERERERESGRESYVRVSGVRNAALFVFINTFLFFLQSSKCVISSVND